MELRKHYFLDKWVIIAQGRGKRPKEFGDLTMKEGEVCFFCPGNEHLTPPEIGRRGEGTWKIRWFQNKFPAVEKKGNPHIQTHNNYYTFGAPFGAHEVVVETPDHAKQLWDLDIQDLSQLFQIYNQRIEALESEEHCKYVIAFKNHGKAAGTSLVHSHTQIASLNLLPKAIEEECTEICHFCSIIQSEKDSYRRCFENRSFVAFAPYASRFPLEVWVLPKQHMRKLSDFGDREFSDIADVLKKVLTKLKEISASYNYYIHYSPKGKNLHFHIELIPRLATWAGFEYGTDIIINTISPEDAAAFYRGDKKDLFG